MNFKQRLANALYGQAVADAVGNPFEFNLHINPVYVVDYANSAGKLIISDDTQMALFGFEAMFNLAQNGGELPSQVRKSFSKSYVEWYKTQRETPSKKELPGLLGFASMYSVQAPGSTCMTSCYRIKNRKAVNNDSKGCGSVMRLLPLVMFYGEEYGIEQLGYINDLAKITGDITHKHPENGVAIDYYMNVAYGCLHGMASRIKDDGVPHISILGEGWTALECVKMAVWAYRKAETFDDLLSLSIAHDGDSDSVAAVAGSLWGLSGREVPQKYIDKLDALDAIQYTISKINVT